MIRIFAWIFAGLGAIIGVLGAAGIMAIQAMPAGGSIFPLPGLILIDWAAAGILGFIAAILAFNTQYHRLGRGIWIMTGALLPLMALGALSIGPWVLAAALCFLVAAILVAVHTKTQLIPNLGYLLIGLIGNLVIILAFILLSALLNGPSHGI